MSNKENCYGKLTRYFHWIVVVLLFTTVFVMFLHEYADSSTLSKKLLNWHKFIGILILVVSVFRLIWKFISNDHPNVGVSKLNRVLANIAHGFLYIFLLSIPILGWLESSAREKMVYFFGLSLPNLISPDSNLADFFQEKHIIFGFIFLGFICMHLGAVIFHFFVKKDAILYSMAPISRFYKN
jgi:cytochrome b561